MSTAFSPSAAQPASPVATPAAQRGLLTLVGIAALGGLWCFRLQLAVLYHLWTTDALRSIGMLIPPLSAVLALRAWRRHDWAAGGSWWGLAPTAAALAVALLQAGLQPDFFVNTPRGMLVFNPIPVGLQLCAYFSGAALLLGGASAWRKAWFPLLLLLFVQPLPTWFTLAADLPLQALAARCARHFADLLDVPVSDGTLKMMFAPALGMFIAPGCDGLRGATTMGYMALVVGYLHRLPWRRWALYVTGAVALAYAFNLLRLCCVVIYYWCALRLPAIGAYGTQIDYAIGGVLFTLAALFVFGIPHYWRQRA
jgi:exosortase J